MIPRLGSWTRTLNEDDAIALLLEATPGTTLAAWQARGHDNLPQASRDRRRETLRIVREELLDREGPDRERITASTYLRLFQEGSPARRLDLLYGRLHAGRKPPWILRTVNALVLPRLLEADQPLAPHDIDIITDEALQDFVAQNLVESTRPTSVEKTRQLIKRDLAKLGVLTLFEPEGDETKGGLGTPRPRAVARAPRAMRVRHAEPDPLAFGWILAHELRTAGRAEAPAAWAVTESIAARLFATRRPYAERCIEDAITAGLLTRGYLAGIPRLHLPEER